MARLTGAFHGPERSVIEGGVAGLQHEACVRHATGFINDEVDLGLRGALASPAETAPDLQDDVVVVDRIIPSQPLDANVDLV